jgi:uncharacterized protein YggE
MKITQIIRTLSKFPSALKGGDKMRTKLILLGLLFLALCTTAVVAENSSLRVIGAGTVETPADTVIISVSAQSMDDNATIASEKNSEMLNKTKDALIAAGVEEDEIMPGRPKCCTKYCSVVCDTVNNTTTYKRVVTNQATERMLIKLNTNDKSETEKVIEAAKSSGAGAVILGYALSDPDKAVEEARKKAMDDARSRAEDYASAFGFKLGKSIEIEEIGYPNIEMGPSYYWDRPMRMHHRFWRDPFSMADRFFGGNYIPAGTAEVTAYTGVTYEIS